MRYLIFTYGLYPMLLVGELLTTIPKCSTSCLLLKLTDWSSIKDTLHILFPGIILNSTNRKMDCFPVA